MEKITGLKYICLIVELLAVFSVTVENSDVQVYIYLEALLMYFTIAWDVASKKIGQNVLYYFAISLQPKSMTEHGIQQLHVKRMYECECKENKI